MAFLLPFDLPQIRWRAPLMLWTSSDLFPSSQCPCKHLSALPGMDWLPEKTHHRMMRSSENRGEMTPAEQRGEGATWNWKVPSLIPSEISENE